MSSYREQGLEAKAVRRGIEEPRPIGGKKRQGKKSVVVEIRYPGMGRWMANWHKFGAYPDLETANHVIANKTRSTRCVGAEYRIKP